MSGAVSGSVDDSNIAHEFLTVVEIAVGFRALHLVGISGDEGLVEQSIQQPWAGTKAWIDSATEVEKLGFFRMTHQLSSAFGFEVGGAPGMVGVGMGEDDATEGGGIMTQFAKSFQNVGSGSGMAGVDEGEAEAVDQKDVDLVVSQLIQPGPYLREPHQCAF